MKTFVLSALLSFIIVSCTKRAADTGVFIRVDNQSPGKIEDVIIYPYNRESPDAKKIGFGLVDAGSASPYRTYPELSTVFSYQFTMHGIGRVETQLRCGNDGSSLPPGKYSMVITLTNGYPEVYLKMD